jgi:hypothetical protein
VRINYGTSLTIPAATELWLAELRAGRGFFRGAILISSPGNFSEIQLLNPAASGKIIGVKFMAIGAAALGSINIRTHNTALGTLVGTGVNLQLGGTAGVGEVRTSQPAAEDGTLVAGLSNSAGGTLPVDFGWFIELDAGEGFLCDPNAVNVGFAATFIWREFVP